MSEFSESYHVRTSEPATALRRIRDAGLVGLVFPPKAGWLTFVPYSDGRVAPYQGAALHGLVRAAQSPVLWYCYGEDHGWRFSYAGPGRRPMRYECWWHPDIIEERSELDATLLEPLLVDPAEFPKLQQLLRPMSVGEAAAQHPAYRFAELLGLPAYRWLSPELVAEEPESFLALGAKKVGRRPARASESISVPPARRVALPRPDLSAREAFDLIRAGVGGWGVGWYPARLFNEGSSVVAGRLASLAPWVVEYRQPHGPAWVRVALWSDGRLTASSNRYLMLAELPDPEGPEPLPDFWLDSPAVAAIVRNEPAPAGAGPLMGFHMHLEAHPGTTTVFWHVDRTLGEYGATAERVEMSYLIRPETGTIAAEIYRRFEGSELLEKRERLR